jgi:hypothetical protein
MSRSINASGIFFWPFEWYASKVAVRRDRKSRRTALDQLSDFCERLYTYAASRCTLSLPRISS